MYKDKTWLYQKVTIEQYRDAEIAKWFNVDRKNISYWRNKFGIESSTKKPENKNKIKLNPEQKTTIIKMYFEDKMSMSDIGIYIGVSPQVIDRAIREEGLIPRSVGQASRQYTCNDSYFETIDSEEKAYWLGFLYADGTVQEKRGTVKLDLKSSDETHIKKFINAIDSNNPIKQGKKVIDGKVFYSSIVNIYSRKMTDNLVMQGCYQNKSLTLSFPSEDQVPRELIMPFIRGYFDGDGSVSYSTPYKKNRRQYKYSIVGTKKFIDEIKIWLNIEHLKTSVQRRKNPLYYVGTSGSTQVEKTLGLLYDNSVIHLDRKYSIYKEMIEYRHNNPKTAWNKGLKKTKSEWRMI